MPHSANGVNKFDHVKSSQSTLFNLNDCVSSSMRTLFHLGADSTSGTARCDRLKDSTAMPTEP